MGYLDFKINIFERKAVAEPYIWLSSKSISKLEKLGETEILRCLGVGFRPIGAKSAWYHIISKECLDKLKKRLNELKIPYRVRWVVT